MQNKLANVEFEGRKYAAISAEDGAWRLLAPTVKYPWLRSVKAIIERADEIDWDVVLESGTLRSEQQLRFLSPLRAVEKIICIGRNYSEHAREMGGEVPELPVIFSKFSSAIIGPGASIVLPAISDQVDYEAELVVVIGKTGRFIDRGEAIDHVFGYTIGNDISARDWQKGRPGGQWLLGKTFDTFAPLGPWIVPSAMIADPNELEIQLKLNGETRQQANTREFIFPIDFLVAHVSQFFTLQPGDLIFTGTPEGVGAGRTPPDFLKNGDVIEITIEGIGTLINPVVAAPSN